MTTTLAELQRWMDAPREDEHLEFKEARTCYDAEKMMKYCVERIGSGPSSMKASRIFLLPSLATINLLMT